MYQKKQVPYHRQTDEINCGPACVQMIASLYGKKTDQEELAKRLGTSKKGTRREGMRLIFDELGLKHKEFCLEGEDDVPTKLKEGHLDALIKSIRAGYAPIVNYSPKGGHYCVAHDFDGTNLIVHDPEIEPDYKIDAKEFENRWFNMNKKWKKWFMIVSDKEITDF